MVTLTPRFVCVVTGAGELDPEVLQLLYHGWRLGQFTRDLEAIGLE